MLSRNEHAKRCKRGRRGFTLAELLLAVAIMGIGLSMAAALLPVGISETERAMNNSLGTIICRNGLAVAKTYITHTEGQNWRDYFSDRSNSIQDSNQLQYNGNPGIGFYVFGRYLESGKNDYELITISYKARNATNVSIKYIGNCAYQDNGKKVIVPSGKENYLQAGSVIIPLRPRGESAYARIESVDKNNRIAYLDRELGDTWQNVRTIYEDGATVSPVMAAMLTRTSLRE